MQLSILVRSVSSLGIPWVERVLVISPSKGFDSDRFLATVARKRVTSVLLVPTVLN
ncbi:hypothetical protein [Amycolatopsis sp. A1MSW2902]|uniref:hypothetical protein n=1 Tax=Amycolatopsis sp. A1MSW2902 TaxID=687413 RepID=UPI00307DAABC